MKHKLIRFFIILSVCVLSSCSQPVGSISRSNGGDVDLFLLIANRNNVYLEGGEVQRRFWRNTSCLKVYGANINDQNLNLTIVNDPLSVDTPYLNVPLPVGGSYEFSRPGQYLIQGTYNGKYDEDTIIVTDRDPAADGGGPGIGIEWLP